MQLANQIAKLANDYSPDAIFVEGVGIGAGVVDRLEELGFPIIDVNPGEKAQEEKLYYNKRAEMWALMRDWMKYAQLPRDQVLRDQLIALEYGFDLRARIQLEKKEDLKKRVPGIGSPDRADALALTFAYPVAARLIRKSFTPAPEAAY